MSACRFLLGCVALSLASTVARPVCGQVEDTPTSTHSPQTSRLGEFLFAATSPTESLRRTSRFLDVDRIDRHLQVALVLDGTDSMDEDLESLKQNLQSFLQNLKDLTQNPVPTVEVAIVVYRDARSPSGPVESVVGTRGEFETNLDRISEALSSVQLEHGKNGTLFFSSCEALDQGLHAALTQLNWRIEAGVSRWVVIAGDAPPYPEGVGFRRFSNQQLIDAARSRNVEIYGMATGQSATPDDRADLRTFLGQLAHATGGHTVDMFDEASIRYWMQQPLRMDPIHEEHIHDLRVQGQVPADNAGHLRIGVLPHLSWDRMSFDVSKSEVISATHLRNRLTRLPGVDVVPASELQLAFESTSVDGVPESQAIRELCQALAADYLVWGSQQINFDYLLITSRLYRGADGQVLASATESVKPVSDAGRLMILNTIFGRLCARSAQELNMIGQTAHARVFEGGCDDTDRRRQLMTPLAADDRAQSAILTGLDHLERSLVFVKPSEGEGGDPAAKHLQAAIGHLSRALEIEPANPYAHLLIADCYHNLTGHQRVDKAMDRCRAHLKAAHAGLDTLLSDVDPIRLEIEAQHALLVVRDVDAAIRHYEALAGSQTERAGRFGLRARWMLAGIHLGEWDAVSYAWDQVRPEKARKHILTILAFWPDSPEARFYRACISNSGEMPPQIPVGNAQLAQTY